MEPPSSPPLPPQVASELPIPRDAELPPTARNILNHKSSSRKRYRHDSYSNSSDPAVFSSDDPNPSVDDYAVKRRAKGTLLGSWWETHKTSANGVRTTRKKAFQRNFDSGVFMGSDLSTRSDSDLPLSDASIGNERDALPSTTQHKLAEPMIPLSSQSEQLDEALGGTAGQLNNTSQTSPTNSRSLRNGHNSQSLASHDSVLQHRVNAELDRCIENGESRVDLSGLQLTRLPSGFAEALKLITISSKNTSQPHPEEYRDLKPKLEVFLGDNDLTELPGELFSVANIARLSLRNNKLTSIPPQISRLKELDELNMSVNNLSYLPFSLKPLLESGSVQKVLLRGNRFVQPVNFQGSLLHPDECIPIQDPRSRYALFAASTVSFLTTTGRPISHSNPLPSQLQHHTPTQQSVRPGFSFAKRPHYPAIVPDRSPSKPSVPSLFELTLRSAPAAQILPFLSTKELADLPLSVTESIHRAAEVQCAGGQECDVCGSQYISPRAEWLEWYNIKYHFEAPTPFPKPFLKRVCSWDCVTLGPNLSNDDWQSYEKSRLEGADEVARPKNMEDRYDVYGRDRVADAWLGCGWTSNLSGNPKKPADLL